MKIGLIGAGAMGSLFGGFLSQKNEVYLIDIWKEHVDAINTQGLIIEEENKEKKFYPKATIDSSNLPTLDLIIIFVKSIHTSMAIKSHQNLINKNTLVLSLQNGYGNIEDLQTIVKKENIIAGTTSHGATVLNAGKIRHAGKGKTCIGAIESNSMDKVELIKNIMEECSIPTEISENILELIWSKLIINIGINPLTALLKVENGKLLNSNYTLNLMKKLVYEAIDVAKELNIYFDKETSLERVKNVAHLTANNKSSMLQDILNKRETEIDKINGAVVTIGKKNNISTPYNEMIVDLIKSTSQLI
ncbi:ketopantoate reductase family protein [Romboutsia sp.]|uniref:ketopantoate reductase family protein n=1 Tax=Romboutsia sp. TaxID=1965302 RepID=UPI003F36A091